MLWGCSEFAQEKFVILLLTPCVLKQEVLQTSRSLRLNHELTLKTSVPGPHSPEILVRSIQDGVQESTC